MPELQKHRLLNRRALRLSAGLLIVIAFVVCPTEGHGQVATSCAGGGSTNAYGTLECTAGQTFCFYDEGDEYGYYEGVQHPFSDVVCDTITTQVCLGTPYFGYGFVVPAESLPSAGTYHFSRQAHGWEGLDSVVVLRIEVRENDSTCLAQVSDPAITVFPNPVGKGALLHVALKNVPKGAQLDIFDNIGRKVFHQEVGGVMLSIPVTFAKGVYTMRVSPAAADAVFKDPIVGRFAVR